MAPYPRFYAGVREMVRSELLEVPTARAIVRRAGIRLSTTPGVSTALVDLSNQYSALDMDGLTYSEYGTLFTLSGTGVFQETFPDPASGGALQYVGDFAGLSEARLLATVTDPGPLGTKLYARAMKGSGGFFFVPAGLPDGRPEVSLETAGLIVSSWKTVEWDVGMDGYAPGQTDLFIDNPNELSGEIGFGLCQLQFRGAP